MSKKEIEFSSQVEQPCEVVYAERGEKDNGRITRLLIPVIAEDSGRVGTPDAAFDKQIGYARDNMSVNGEALGEEESAAAALRAAFEDKTVQDGIVDFLIKSGRAGVLYNPLGIKIDLALAGHSIFLPTEASEVHVDYEVQEDGSVLVTNTFSGEYLEESKQFEYADYSAGLKAEKPNTTKVSTTIVHRVEMKEGQPVVSIVDRKLSVTGEEPQHVNVINVLLADTMGIALKEGFDKDKALEDALLRGHSKAIISLLKQGARIDVRAYGQKIGKTVLHYAVEAGEVELVKELLKEEHANVAVNIRDNQGKTALHYAAAANSEEMVLALVDKGAKVTIPDRDNKIAYDYSRQNSPVESYLYVLTGVEAYYQHSAAKKFKSENTKNKLGILNGLKEPLVGEGKGDIPDRLQHFDTKAIATITQLETPENKGLLGWFAKIFRNIKEFKREKFGGRAVQTIIVPSDTQSSHGTAFLEYIVKKRRHLDTQLSFFPKAKASSSVARQEVESMILGA